MVYRTRQINRVMSQVSYTLPNFSSHSFRSSDKAMELCDVLKQPKQNLF